MNDLKQFTGLYSLSKTLRFELKPIGRTQEWIDKNHVLENDEQRNKDYPKVKEMIDDYHKLCINESLKDAHFDWNPLRDAIIQNRHEKTDESKKALEVEQAKMRALIHKKLSEFKYYNELNAATPSKLINDILPKNKAVESFNSFSTYFEEFQENRKNIYTEKAISTSVPYRIVHDNFPKFLSNIAVFDNIKTLCPEVVRQVATEMSPFLHGVLIEDIFSVDFYNILLTQEGIEFYNHILGGVVKEEHYYQGVNQLVNLFRQAHTELTTKKQSLTMVPLHKQILSDRESISDILQPIDTEEQLITLLNQFYQHITNYSINGNDVNVIKELIDLVISLDKFNPDGIFLSAKSLTDISHSLYGQWNILKEKMFDKAVKTYGNTNVAKNKKKVDAFVNKDAYSLAELSFGDGISVTQYFTGLTGSFDTINNTWEQFQKWCDSSDTPKLVHNDSGTELLKNLLDAIMEVLHKCSVLVVSLENNLDDNFYNTFLPLYEELRNVVSVYDRTRNFLTQKPSDISKKIKLKFDIPSLGVGWGINKERKNKAILLFKDGLSYLGIMNVKGTLDFDGKAEPDEPTFRKMVCINHSKPYMDLPNSFFRQTGIDKFHPSERILKIYEAFKKDSKSVNINEVRELIDYYKEAINRNEDWNSVSFTFSPTETYETIDDFYKEVARQSYQLSFTDISQKQVDEWVDNGQLYLFQLYNKDYAEGFHGRKNLHTLYWESLFTAENLSDTVIKLGSNAELFYRPQVIKKPVKHEVGTKMLNRRDKSGMPIPDAIYRSLYQYFNGKKTESELTTEERAYTSQVIVKDVQHEIIKDRRYTKKHHYQFHIPIVINANATGKVKLNDKVKEYIQSNPDINIIGIDRGERHLIYLTLINQRGEILKQKTFNIVGNYNYQEKLKQREKERDEARKSWQSIGKIKDLKEGFLSAVVHEIATLMVKHNAIVVLEDLNRGFKKGRFKVERQVYQKFEKMLIDKLNYLSFKDRAIDQDGGILRGFQLTAETKNYTDIGRQTGFLFYIPAAYTSKIDPVTGFVNLFNLNDITNTEKRKAFFMNMKRIEMRNGNVEFEFDYRKFKTYQTDFQNEWTVNTAGKRIVFDAEKRQSKDIYPTQEIVRAFDNKGIKLKNGMDLKAIIAGIEETDVKNASFFSSLFYAFKTTLQMRNSNASTEEDYIMSPVAKNGYQFCTNEVDKEEDAEGYCIAKLPVDADANGAYHIALKGLYLIKNSQTKKIENEKWFKFMVEKPYLK